MLVKKNIKKGKTSAAIEVNFFFREIIFDAEKLRTVK